MGIYQALTAKPWLAEQGVADNQYAGGVDTEPVKKLMLRIFLGVVATLFMLMVVAYGGRMGYEDWRPAPQLRLLWANTLVLFLGSVALQWALSAVRQGRIDTMRVALLAAGAFTIVFLFGQMLAWKQLSAMVNFDMANPAIGFFYMITGVHGLHLLGGLVAWGRAISRVWGKFDTEKMRQSVELCALYWHFLLLVWVVLFVLLFTGNNLDLLLKLCGIR